MRLLIPTFLAAVFCASTVGAATYYVAPRGNDSARGGIKEPFRTITKAARVARPGDIVNVRAGTYSMATTISSRGTAAAGILFRAMPGESVVLDGSRLRKEQAVVELTEARYVDFSGFEIRNAPQIGIALWQTRNTRVLGNHVHHTARNGIYAGANSIGGSSDLTIDGNDVHDTVLENRRHTMRQGGWAGAVVFSKTERATVTHNRIWNNDGEGLIALRSNHALIRSNEIFDNFSAYLYLDNARFITADRNLIYSTGIRRYFREGRPGAGIAVANETKDVMNPSSDNVFTSNVVVGTRWGFYYGNYESGGGLRNTKVLSNTFYGTTEEVIRIEDDRHANTLIENNLFHQLGTPAPKYASGKGVSYWNNVWSDATEAPAIGAGPVARSNLPVPPQAER